MANPVTTSFVTQYLPGHALRLSQTRDSNPLINILLGGCLSIFGVTHPTAVHVHSPFGRIISDNDLTFFPDRKPTYKIAEHTHTKLFLCVHCRIGRELAGSQVSR